MNTFKEKDPFAHAYLICRFDSCFLIDPSHDFEEIKLALNGRTLNSHKKNIKCERRGRGGGGGYQQ